MSSCLDDIEGAWDWWPTAEENGLSFAGYWSRIIRRGMSPEEAATKPKEKGGRPPAHTSIRQICKRAGIDRRHFYRIREELMEEGLDVNTEDVIAAAQDRSRSRSNTS